MTTLTKEQHTVYQSQMYQNSNTDNINTQTFNVLVKINPNSILGFKQLILGGNIVSVQQQYQLQYCM